MLERQMILRLITRGKPMFAKSRKTILLTILATLLCSCGKKEGRARDVGGAPSVPALYTLTKDVAPVITSSGSTSALKASPAGDSGSLALEEPWTWSNPLFEIYNLIREYHHPQDVGVIDGSNMYQAIFTAGERFEGSINECTPMDDSAVAPVFDFGNDLLDQTYNCSVNFVASYDQPAPQDETPEGGDYNPYANSWLGEENIDKEAVWIPSPDKVKSTAYVSAAVKQDGDDKYLISGETYVEEMAEGVDISRGATNATYNQETKDLVVNLTYVGGNPDFYSVRIYVAGNGNTGLFTLKLSRYMGSGAIHSIAGYGYSKGDNYYLFRMKSSAFGNNFEPRYFCFKSYTTEEELRLMDSRGSETVPEECAQFVEHLPEDNFATDGSDNPVDENDFIGLGVFNTALDLP
jgi:hypothetical protein